MLRAAKKAMPLSVSIAVWPLLLLVATLFLTGTRLCNFKISFSSVSAKISIVDSVAVGKNAVVYAYDASGSPDFEFDGNTLGNGLGVRTKASQQNPPYEQKITQHDPWSRIAKETTNQGSLTYELVGTSHFANVRLQINKIPLGSVASNADCSWKMPVSLQPGSYLLEASGEGASLENCPPNQKVERNFTVGPQARTHERTYDGEGNLTKTITAGPENQTKTQEYTWDAWGHLVKVTERDHQNNGYDWSVIRDNFGRRLKTTYTPITAGTPITAKTETISSYFDPQIEFLEVGVKVNADPITWKMYGVDKDGTYGGLQGIGGLEAIITPTKTYSIIHDALGHVVATHDGTEAKRVPTQVGSYGPLPGSLALPLSSARGLHEVTHWQGRRIDPTQLVGIGERELDLGSGTWISGDPFGHFASWSLHSFCYENPIAYCDPTGRIATKFAQDTGLKDAYYSVGDTAINVVPGGLSLLSWGIGAAMKATGMPYGHLYQQAGAIDERLSPYARAGFYDPNSVVATAVAAGSVLVAPGSAPTKIASRGAQTVAQSGVKALHKQATSTKTTTLGNYWPPNQGFLGQPKNDFLMPGITIDRYGGLSGKFASPLGTSFEARGLPAQYLNTKPYNMYEIVKPFEVRSGPALPAFGQQGLGTQYELPVSVDILLKRGIIRELQFP